MPLKIPLPQDADHIDFVHHHENFYTSLVALALLKARETTLEKINGLPVWWKPQEDSEGQHLGELLSKSFSISVLQSFADCPGVPDLRLSNSDTLVLAETKLSNPLEESQMKAIDWLAGRREKARAYLVFTGSTGQCPREIHEPCSLG